MYLLEIYITFVHTIVWINVNFTGNISCINDKNQLDFVEVEIVVIVGSTGVGVGLWAINESIDRYIIVDFHTMNCVNHTKNSQ